MKRVIALLLALMICVAFTTAVMGCKEGSSNPAVIKDHEPTVPGQGQGDVGGGDEGEGEVAQPEDDGGC